MEKLLHERLREHEDGRFDIEFKSKSLGCHTSDEMKKIAERLTALIERGA